MTRLGLVIFGIVFLKYILCLTDVEKTCVKDHSDAFDNDYLLGTWYVAYRFDKYQNQVPSPECTEINVRTTNETEIEAYKKAYTLDNPYSFEDNPLFMEWWQGFYQGLIMGNNQVKFFVYDPKSVYFKKELYKARAYIKTSFDDYVLYHECDMRGSVRWLLSRKKHPTVEELATVIKTIKEVERMTTRRYCALF